jgi:ankyrin repeat protein
MILILTVPADKEARTTEENQTPVFYAAKSDATNSLKALIKQGCKYKLVRDYRNRTPIHVAAELGKGV